MLLAVARRDGSGIPGILIGNGFVWRLPVDRHTARENNETAGAKKNIHTTDHIV